MSKTARQAERVTGHRPSGRQCAECQRAAEDCSRLDFAAMPPAGKRDADGVQRVACRCYVRADEHPCCGALANGPHKMGCDYKLVATKYSNEINELQQKQDDFVRASGHQIKPCRCGPDGCADSVACPRR